MTGKRVLLEEAAAIRTLAEDLGRFDEAVEAIFECGGRVITCGVGKSGHIARKTAGTLSSTGTPSLFLHAAEAVHGDLGMVTDRDIVLMYSHSGETDELVRLFPSIRALGARTILITGRPDSSAGRLADLVLDTKVTDEACPNNLAPTTSTTVMLALSDALAVAVMEKRKFGKEDFAKFHPSGTLGKRLLLKVTDVMRPLDEIAVVDRDDPVLEVSRAITQAGVGAACVVENGHLAGFISDGDLRRHLSHGGDVAARAEDLMTTGVATIEPDMLAIDAFEVFQNMPKRPNQRTAGIGEMPVLRDGLLIGLLMLKDLVRSGIL
ncbi:MAG TPA: KpsF/GutQ family sugar-phosphate isomerase [Fimbriimonadaceae bacterium]|nr:KpsF/GutQ family sugar-phosphate isomerase [Fimbriimonadaceae bacterium]